MIWFTSTSPIFMRWFFLFIVICLFRAAPAAYGGSQARGAIGATAAVLHHSSQQCQIFNPLSKTRVRTHNLMDPSWICFHCTTTGTPRWFFLSPFLVLLYVTFVALGNMYICIYHYFFFSQLWYYLSFFKFVFLLKYSGFTIRAVSRFLFRRRILVPYSALYLSLPFLHYCHLQFYFQVIKIDSISSFFFKHFHILFVD